MQQLEPPKHFIKQKKPHIEEDILYDSIYENFKGRQINTVATEMRITTVFGGVWWGGEGHWLEREQRNFWGDGNARYLALSNGVTQVYTFAKTNYTLKLCAFYCV